MPRLLSLVPDRLQFQSPGRVPLISGAFENRFPAPVRSIGFGEIVEFPRDAADVALAKFGKRGVIEIAGDESDDQAHERGERVRLKFLQGFLDNYRNLNATLRAQGVPVLLPRQIHRDHLREMKGLQLRQEKLDAELLQGGVAGGPVNDEDVAARDMAAFGLPAEAVPLVPGVEDGLSGIGSLHSVEL